MWGCVHEDNIDYTTYTGLFSCQRASTITGQWIFLVGMSLHLQAFYSVAALLCYNP